MSIKTITKQLFLANLLMFLLVCVTNAQDGKKADSNCEGNGALTSTEISGILEAHNKARADVNLPPLTWSCKLAEMAQGWANRGIFEHSPDSDFGENIAAALHPDSSPITSITAWWQEKSFWDNTAAQCQTGKACYHYTQIVWKKTTEVGCGINRNSSGKMKMFFVCNYNPAGNFPGPAY